MFVFPRHNIAVIYSFTVKAGGEFSALHVTCFLLGKLTLHSKTSYEFVSDSKIFKKRFFSPKIHN